MDHVNASQSTNDAYPTGFRIAVYNSILKLIDKIQYLHDGFDNKAKEFAKILKWVKIPITRWGTYDRWSRV